MIQVVNNLPKEDNVIDYKATIRGSDFSNKKCTIESETIFADYSFTEGYFPEIKKVECTKDMCLAYAKTQSDEIYTNTKALLENSLSLEEVAEIDTNPEVDSSGNVTTSKIYDYDLYNIDTLNISESGDHVALDLTTELDLPDDFEFAIHIRITF